MHPMKYGSIQILFPLLKTIMDLGFLKWALRSMFCVIGYSWSSSVVVDEGSIGPSGKLLCLSQPLPPQKNDAAHAWHHCIHA